jgi:hypothetical protein
MQYPHKNIVRIFEVGTDYVIMEQVNINLNCISKDTIQTKMTIVKDHLQNLGIIYRLET